MHCQQVNLLAPKSEQRRSKAVAGKGHLVRRSSAVCTQMQSYGIECILYICSLSHIFVPFSFTVNLDLVEHSAVHQIQTLFPPEASPEGQHWTTRCPCPDKELTVDDLPLQSRSCRDSENDSPSFRPEPHGASASKSTLLTAQDTRTTATPHEEQSHCRGAVCSARGGCQGSAQHGAQKDVPKYVVHFASPLLE